MRSIAGVASIALFTALAACDAEPLRIQPIAMGERVVARFDPPIANGSSAKRWVALVREGSTTESDRVFVDEGAREVVVNVPQPGAYELVLHEGARIIARARVTVDHAPVAQKEPPVWYW